MLDLTRVGSHSRHLSIRTDAAMTRAVRDIIQETPPASRNDPVGYLRRCCQGVWFGDRSSGWRAVRCAERPGACSSSQRQRPTRHERVTTCAQREEVVFALCRHTLWRRLPSLPCLRRAPPFAVNDPSAKSGVYKLVGNAEVYCDLKTDGGGMDDGGVRTQGTVWLSRKGNRPCCQATSRARHGSAAQRSIFSEPPRRW